MLRKRKGKQSETSYQRPRPDKETSHIGSTAANDPDGSEQHRENVHVVPSERFAG